MVHTIWLACMHIAQGGIVRRCVICGQHVKKIVACAHKWQIMWSWPDPSPLEKGLAHERPRQDNLWNLINYKLWYFGSPRRALPFNTSNDLSGQVLHAKFSYVWLKLTPFDLSAIVTWGISQFSHLSPISRFETTFFWNLKVWGAPA